jgi:hypothetical protein
LRRPLHSPERDTEQHAGCDQDAPVDHEDHHLEGDKVMPQDAQTDEGRDGQHETQDEQASDRSLDPASAEDRSREVVAIVATFPPSALTRTIGGTQEMVIAAEDISDEPTSSQPAISRP